MVREARPVNVPDLFDVVSVNARKRRRRTSAFR
jgi:hypothetical protein